VNYISDFNTEGGSENVLMFCAEGILVLVHIFSFTGF
jgi:hypothetical protein